MTPSTIALILAFAAQQTAAPTDGVAPASDEAGRANRDALAATAAQTARIREDRDTNARNLAGYEEAKADYARSLARLEAERTAAARKAADDAAAYQRQLETWRASLKARSTPVHQPSAVATAKPAPQPRCTFETLTGSSISRRVCRSD